MNKFSKPALNATTSVEPTVRMILTVAEFGARYRVKKQTVWSWLRIGLPHLKLSPRKTVIPTTEADRWVEQRFFCQRQGHR